MTGTKSRVVSREEAQRETKFPCIEYRDSPIGRQPYMKGSGLAVWEAILIARPRGMSAEKIVQDYPYPVENIRAALHFYAVYQDEINQALEDNDIGYETMKRLFPNVRLFEVPQEAMGEKVNP